MHLQTLKVKNFRALKDIEVQFCDGVNVIVGPNAVGKTTVLEAIRLAKAMLAPRTANEGNQALLGIGAVAQHNQNQLIPEALAQNVNFPVVINSAYKLTSEELVSIEKALPRIVTRMVQARFAGLNQSNLAAFFSSPMGRGALTEADKEIREKFDALKSLGGICNLNLTIDFQSSRTQTDDPAAAEFIRWLDQDLPPPITKLSYFPADRALPRGEQPVQLGHQNANQQLESHNAQPQLKYNRLKNTIFSTIVEGPDAAVSLLEEFKTIFGLLKGKEIVKSGVNQHGQLTTLVKDVETGRVFDIDAMSSGEKGLILTFLLIAKSVSPGGLILLDEPELHLNPAVCKDILSFLSDQYVRPRGIQAIICSHSPEILAGAFGREECSLYHLVSETNLTRVRHQDIEEISQALRRLGTSESEELLYKGTVFVEGDEDVDLLEVGFSSLLRKYKLKALGGRKEVEKQIQALVNAEARGGVVEPKYFIFDRDGKPTHLSSSENVKVLQWDRYCLENYLIDFEALTDLLKDSEVAKNPITNQGAVIALFKTAALSQLDDVVLEQAYAQLEIESSAFPYAEVAGKSADEVGRLIFERLNRIKQKLGATDAERWAGEFSKLCVQKRNELAPVWEQNWQKLCDGKRLFSDFRKCFQLRISSISFKRRVMVRMSQMPGTENWRAIEGLLRSLIN